MDRIKWQDSKVKIHWFGGSKYEWLIQTPVASCDTTSWVKTGGFGHIYFGMSTKMHFTKATRSMSGDIREEDDRSYHFVTYPWRMELEEYLHNDFRFQYGDLLGYNDKFNMQIVNTRFFPNLKQELTSSG